MSIPEGHLRYDQPADQPGPAVGVLFNQTYWDVESKSLKGFSASLAFPKLLGDVGDVTRSTRPTPANMLR